jgi:hypothetical protein
MFQPLSGHPQVEMVIHTLKLHWPMFTVFGFYSSFYRMQN